MENVNNIISLFSKFQLEKIGDNWVTTITDSDFTEIEDLPIEFVDHHAATNFGALLNETAKSLRDWIDNCPDTDVNNSVTEVRKASLTCLSTSSIYERDVNERNVYSQFWIDLTSIVNTKALLSFIFYHSYRAQHYDANEERRELGILSSSVYFLLLCVPGSNAFGLFHPVLYLKCLDILRLTTKLNIGASSPRKKGVKVVRRSSEDMITHDDEEEEASYLSSQETSKLIRSLNILLNDFLRFSKKFSLKHSTESLEQTLSILVEITKCELHNANGIFINRHAANSVSALAYNAYVALQEMCSPLHGNVPKTIKLIMKFVMPNILMTSRGTSDLSLRGLGVIREHSVIFVKYLYTQMKEDANSGVFILLQHLCLRVTDKADYREKTARSVVDILHIFPVNFYTRFIQWLYKFSHNEKAGHRLFTLEIISKLLDQDERKNEENISNGSNLESCHESTEVKSFGTISSDHSAINEVLKQNVLSHKFLLGIIFSRCRDSAATVRAKALSLLAGCTLSSNSTIAESMKEVFFGPATVFQTPHIDEANINCESPAEMGSPMTSVEFPNAKMIFNLLQRRAIDDRVSVRKSALQVLENLIKMDRSFAIESNLNILVRHCRDFALFIRKQMIVSLTSILDVYPNNNLVVNMWVSGVMPLILDPEIKVQEKVLEVVDSTLFCSIDKHREIEKNAKSHLPWKIINAVTSLSLNKFFSKVIMLWCKSEFQKPNILAKVKTHIGTSINEQAWTLLAILAQYMVFKEPIFALEYYEQHSNDITEVSSYTLQQVLKVLQCSIKHIPQDRAQNLRIQLLDYIESFQLEVELISVVIDCITLITYSIYGEEAEGQSQIEKWAAPILKSCEQYLKNILFPLIEVLLSKDEEELFFRHLFTLGETSLLCPTKVNKRMFLMLQSLIFHDSQTKDAEVVMPSTQTQSSQPPAVSFKPTTRLKAVAVVTLGKMCLQHEDQAKRIIPALGKILDVTTGSAIKINTIFVLSDMCVRYATLVDPLIPQITGCLRDPDVQVRKTTLTLLISLLQEDYLKLKGSFFYRILQCLCDDHEEIKSTVIFFMTERLLKRFPNAFLQHFIECIFHYNCYEEHESYNKFVQSDQEKELFSLAGPQHRQERKSLYCFMLEHMSDDQRFATTQKLCQDVLGGILGGRIKLTPSSQSVLEDTLVVLSSEEIKLAFLKSTPEDTDQPTDRAEKEAMTGIIVKRTIVSQVVKQNVIENIVPILISLKHRLEEQRSPMMKQLLLYIKEIMKDYKNEVKEILAGDKQLAKEIEFDLRRIEREQLEKDEEVLIENNQRPENVVQENDSIPMSRETFSPLRPPIINISPQILDRNSDKVLVPVRRMSVNLLKTALLNRRRQSISMANAAVSQETIIHKKRSRSLERELNTDNEELKDASGSEMNSDQVIEKNINNPTEKSDHNISRNQNVIENSENIKGVIQKENINDDSDAIKQKTIYALNAESSLTDESNSGQGATGEVNPVEIIKCNHTKETNSGEGPTGEVNPVEIIEDNSKDVVNENNEEVDKTEDNYNIDNIGAVEQQGNNLQENTITESFVKVNPRPNMKVVKVFSTTIMENKNQTGFLRAISTPQKDKSIFQNITFINKSHDVSAIGLNSLDLSSTSTDQSHSVLVNLKSPEAFVMDEQFSRLRRSKRGNNVKEVVQQVKPATKKRPSGEALFESFNSRHNEEISTKDESSSNNFLKPLTPSGKNDDTPNTSRKSSRQSSVEKRKSPRQQSVEKRKSPLKRKRPRYK